MSETINTIPIKVQNHNGYNNFLLSYFILFFPLFFFSCLKKNELVPDEFFTIKMTGVNLRKNIQFIGDSNYITLDSTSKKIVLWNSVSNIQEELFQSEKPIIFFGSDVDCVIACTDSLYFLYNMSSKKLRTYTYSPEFNLLDEPYYSIDSYVHRKLVLIDSAVILTRIYPLEISSHDDEYFEKNCLAFLNLPKQSYKTFDAKYPELFVRNRYGSVNNLFFGKYTNGIYFCDQVSGMVTIYNFEGQEISKINLSDERLSTASLDSVSNSDLNITFDHYHKTSFIQDFFFNEFNDKFYRVLKLDISQEILEDEALHKYVIQEFDSQFNKTGEILLNSKYNTYRIINSSEGILVNYPSLNKINSGFTYRLIKSHE